MSIIVALTTAPDESVALKLARGLVKDKLAACVNLVPSVRSVYVWDGDIQDETEVQLIIKSTSSQVQALKTYLSAQHPYKVPELLVLTVADGAQSYLDWVSAAVGVP